MLSFEWHFEGPHVAAAHRHPRAHIILPERGSCWVVAPEGTWLVPTGQAIWIPSWVPHQVFSPGSVAARMIFIDETCVRTLPPRCGAVSVTSFLRELTSRALAYGNSYGVNGPETRLARVLLDEMSSLEPSPLLIPVSKDPRLAGAMERLVRDPGGNEVITQVARHVGTSGRTLARLFRVETGMTFIQWRTRLRLVESIKRLTQGARVTEVALDMGYSSTSSFVCVFRQHLGIPPVRYARGLISDRTNSPPLSHPNP